MTFKLPKKPYHLAIFLFIIFLGVITTCWKPCQGHPGKCLLFFDTTGTVDPVQMWIWYMSLLLALCVVVGHAIKDRLAGFLIDQRNKMSLARFQLVLWTILLLGGILTAVLINVCLGIPDPMAIKIDQQLWALMGISGVSLAATGLIHDNKRKQPENVTAKNKLMAWLGDNDSSNPKINVKGVLVENVKAEDASWLDLFLGEESGNGEWMDLGKVQMFIFTLVVWFGYASVLGSAIYLAVFDATGLKEFPELSPGMVALLGISHAAYIGNTAIPKTPVEK